METVPLEALTDPSYTERLSTLPIAEVRARRDRCSEAEVGVSYARRLVHGRLDIVHAEQRLRQGEGGSGGRGDIHALVEQLPQILAENVHAPGNGRLPQIMAPGESDLVAAREVDAVAPLAVMGRLERLSDEELATLEGELHAVEQRISGQRHQLHDVFDKLQEEIIRRYRSGEADVDDLLR